MHLVVDAYGVPIRTIITKGIEADSKHGVPIRTIITKGIETDSKQAIPLINGITAEISLGDKAFDTNEILKYCTEHNIQAVIPPKKNRKEQRDYDEHLYKLRHLVENAILKLSTKSVICVILI